MSQPLRRCHIQVTSRTAGRALTSRPIATSTRVGARPPRRLGPGAVGGAGESPRVHGHRHPAGLADALDQQGEGQRARLPDPGQRGAPGTEPAGPAGPRRLSPDPAEVLHPLQGGHGGDDRAGRQPQPLGQVVTQPAGVEVLGQECTGHDQDEDPQPGRHADGDL